MYVTIVLIVVHCSRAGGVSGAEAGVEGGVAAHVREAHAAAGEGAAIEAGVGEGAAATGLVAAAVLPPSSSSRISPTAFFSSRVRARPTYSPRWRQLRTWRYPHFPVSAAIALTRRRREALPMLATLDMSTPSAPPHGTQTSSSSVSEVRPSSMIRPFMWVNQQSLRVHLRPNLHVVTVRRRPPDGLLCPAPFRPSALVVRDHRRSGAFILRADARSETEPRRAPSEGRPDGEMLVRAPSASASSASSGAM